MTALVLHQHSEFASRCANTDRSFFFGPAKEQLWYVVDWEYRRPALLRQHADAVWSRLRLLFLGGAEPSCILYQLTNDVLHRQDCNCNS